LSGKKTGVVGVPVELRVSVPGSTGKIFFREGGGALEPRPDGLSGKKADVVCAPVELRVSVPGPTGEIFSGERGGVGILAGRFGR